MAPFVMDVLRGLAGDRSRNLQKGGRPIDCFPGMRVHAYRELSPS